MQLAASPHGGKVHQVRETSDETTEGARSAVKVVREDTQVSEGSCDRSAENPLWASVRVRRKVAHDVGAEQQDVAAAKRATFTTKPSWKKSKRRGRRGSNRAEEHVWM